MPSAVLDEAHVGDIEGALGRIRIGEQEDQPRGLRRRLVIFLAKLARGTSESRAFLPARRGLLS